MTEALGFKHKDDWERHPYGCDCFKCEEKFNEGKLKLIRILQEEDR